LLIREITRSLHHHFPDFFDQLVSINDPRKKAHYSIQEIVFAGIALFVFKCGSRNSMDNLRQEEQFSKNYQKAFGLRLPDLDTVALVFNCLNENELQAIKKQLINHLIKRKVLDKFRVNGMHLVAVDGTGLVSFKKRHCDECLTKTSKNGVVTYFHNVLEAKIVTSNGFSISLCTEWIENANIDYQKQDCELNAFNRLTDRLKKEYPRLPICVCVDGLYPTTRFFSICLANRWGYIVVLKDDRLSKLWNKIVRLQHEYFKKKNPDGKETMVQRCWFSNAIEHNGFTHNWVELEEERLSTEGNIIDYLRFVFLTNQPICKNNALMICQAGRTRWKIEKQGFDQQKNHGYHISHKYCRKSVLGLKNFYQCCQIGHLLNQLVELSVEFRRNLIKKVTIKHLWKCLVAQLICLDIPQALIQEEPLFRYRSQFIE
jgi:hypothetical protein